MLKHVLKSEFEILAHSNAPISRNNLNSRVTDRVDYLNRAIVAGIVCDNHPEIRIITSSECLQARQQRISSISRWNDYDNSRKHKCYSHW